MNIKSYVLPCVASLMLAGCGGGVSTPDEVRGTWSDACPTGMLSVDADTLHILYPSKQDFTLTASEFDGKMWKASFKNAGGDTVTDNYVLEDGSLTLDTVTINGATSTGSRIKMTKCE